MIEENNNDKITIFLSTLTDEEQDIIPALISNMRKEVKEQEKQAKIDSALEMYSRVNLLGKNMYTIAEVAKYIGISKNVLSKALQEQVTESGDESPVEEVIEAIR